MKIDRSVKNVLSIFAFETALNLGMVNNAYAESNAVNVEINGEIITFILLPTITAIVTIAAVVIDYFKTEKENKMFKFLKRDLNYVHDERYNNKLIF